MVTATDPDGDRVTYSLVGGDTELFNIDSATGQLMTMAALDYETKDSYTVEVMADDGNGGTDTIEVTIMVTDVGLDDSYDANEDGMIDGDRGPQCRGRLL